MDSKSDKVGSQSIISQPRTERSELAGAPEVPCVLEEELLNYAMFAGENREFIASVFSIFASEALESLNNLCANINEEEAFRLQFIVLVEEAKVLPIPGFHRLLGSLQNCLNECRWDLVPFLLAAAKLEYDAILQVVEAFVLHESEAACELD